MSLEDSFWDVRIRWKRIKNIHFLNVYLQIEVLTLKRKTTTPYCCNLLMCFGDDDECWLPVITAPPAHTRVIIVTADDGSFVPHWCNRRRGTFSDLSPNYTLWRGGRANQESSWINARQQGTCCLLASQICGCCRPPADLTEKNLGKHSRSSPVAQRRTSGLEEVKEVLSFLWGQRGACDFMFAGGVSEVLMQMRSF